jgi:hypothetical protein
MKVKMNEIYYALSVFRNENRKRFVTDEMSQTELDFMYASYYENRLLDDIKTDLNEYFTGDEADEQKLLEFLCESYLVAKQELVLELEKEMKHKAFGNEFQRAKRLYIAHIQYEFMYYIYHVLELRYYLEEDFESMWEEGIDL